MLEKRSLNWKMRAAFSVLFLAILKKEMKRLAERYDETIKKYETVNQEYLKVPFVPGEDALYQKMNESCPRQGRLRIRQKKAANCGLFYS